MALFTLPGITADDRVPMFAAENKFGQGKSAGAGPWYVVCTGNKLASGSMTADLDVVQAFSEDEVAGYVGERSECAQQAREALAAGAAVVLAPVAEAGGAVSATLVLNCEAVGTGTGEVGLYLGDQYVSWVVDTASVVNTMTAAAAAINAIPTLFCVATLGAGPAFDITITVSSAGIRGNDYVAKLDLTQAPTNSLFTIGRDADPVAIKTLIATVAAPASYSGATLTGTLANPGPAIISPPRQVSATLSAAVGAYTNGSTITFTGLDAAGAALVEAVTISGTGGGTTLITAGYFSEVTQIDIQAQAAITGEFTFGTFSQASATASGWVRFAGGSGTDTCANVINLLEAGEYRRIAAAQNDATNAARWEAHADSESAPLIDHLEQVIFGLNSIGTTDPIALAQTTLNAYLCSVYAQKNSRKHPCQIAAKVAALRCVAESTNPWTRYDGTWQDTTAQLWSDVAAHQLDVWSHAELKALLNAGVAPINDFAGDTRIVRSICSHSLNGANPDYRCLDTADVSVSQYVRDEVQILAEENAQQNPGVGPDLPDGLPQIAGISTPAIWNATVQARLEEIEAVGWIIDVATNPPITAYNTVALRNETIVPVVVRPHQHQILASIRQVAA
jgi:hypothetical protein